MKDIARVKVKRVREKVVFSANKKKLLKNISNFLFMLGFGLIASYNQQFGFLIISVLLTAILIKLCEEK